jgi:hypothetical protein
MSGVEAETTGLRGMHRALKAWLCRPMSMRITLNGLTWAAVALGIALRVLEYLDFRQLYMDEASLLKNLVGRAIFDFQHVLEDDQMAPPGFLVIERVLLRLPLPVKAAGRLFPLICGLATVFLFRSVARRYLDRRAVPIAVALFAMGDHLLYYSSEIKQYSCDLMLTLATFLLAAPPSGSGSPRTWRALAIFGLVAPWFSFPVVFPLAAVGLQWIAVGVRRKDAKVVAATCGTCLAWAVSFGLCYLLSRSILSRRDFIWVWWNFAFLPLPPRSLGELSLLGKTLANVFINPGSLITPLLMPFTAAIASILWLYGFLSLGRRWPGGLLILVGPLLFALAASALHLYPFHGRLLLFLVPSLLLLMSEGIAAMGRRIGWPAAVLLAGLFVYGEAAEIAWHRFVQPRARTFDSHGDLKNDLLDYLDDQRRLQSGLRREASPPGDPGR